MTKGEWIHNRLKNGKIIIRNFFFFYYYVYLRNESESHTNLFILINFYCVLFGSIVIFANPENY